MTYFEDIQDYIEQLCVKHKQLRHGTGGTAFINMRMNQEPLSYTDLKNPYVKLDIANTTFRETDQVWSVGIECMYNINALDREADLEEASRVTQKILYDFRARIYALAEEECSFINRLLDCDMEPIIMDDQSAAGWTLVWRFVCFGPDYDVKQFDA